MCDLTPILFLFSREFFGSNALADLAGIKKKSDLHLATHHLLMHLAFFTREIEGKECLSSI